MNFESVLLKALLGVDCGLSYESYSLRKVTDMLKAENINYTIVKNKLDGVYYTACRVSFTNSDICVSVQTNPSVAGSSFCETAILNGEGLLYISSLGYYDVIRHNEPSDFLEHIKTLKNNVSGRMARSFPEYSSIPIMRPEETKTSEDSEETNDSSEENSSENSNPTLNNKSNDLLTLLLLQSLLKFPENKCNCSTETSTTPNNTTSNETSNNTSSTNTTETSTNTTSTETSATPNNTPSVSPSTNPTPPSVGPPSNDLFSMLLNSLTGNK